MQKRQKCEKKHLSTKQMQKKTTKIQKQMHKKMQDKCTKHAKQMQSKTNTCDRSGLCLCIFGFVFNASFCIFWRVSLRQRKKQSKNNAQKTHKKCKQIAHTTHKHRKKKSTQKVVCDIWLCMFFFCAFCLFGVSFCNFCAFYMHSL